jgi:hypothetical protein
MKLSAARVERTLNQFDAEPIPDNHPAMAQLNRLFGEHTFFLDGKGLHIVEPDGSSESGTATGKVINLADWKDAERTSLTPHEPQDTSVVVVLDGSKPDGAG